MNIFALIAAVRTAMWNEDLDVLWQLAPCRCCCAEHTSPWCNARLWNGCYSGLQSGDER